MTHQDDDGQGAFEKLAEDIRREYAYAALAKLKDAETSAGRSVLVMVILAAIFELLNRGVITELAFSGMELANARFVNIFILVLLAYQWSLFVDLTIEIDSTANAYRIASLSFLKQVKGAEWWSRILTPGASVVTIIMRSEPVTEDRSSKIAYTMNGFRAVLFVMWPVAFIIYGYIELFLHYSPLWLVIVSLLISMIQIFLGSLSFFVDTRAPEHR